ncbi:hypothetical protein SAMN04489806_1104 [Paramicrobacterium humi]|uniref:Uncharacterized protein n=2 Tax=Paramicrobacterium humi TaxID=640635 RepID=A0A1H4KBN8_9MICO|nr:hypothetical protein SAMN04489806_1104 [Microbacterium humi]
MSWEEFQASYEPQEGEITPDVFAAYLRYLSDGRWNGEAHESEQAPEPE